MFVNLVSARGVRRSNSRPHTHSTLYCIATPRGTTKPAVFTGQERQRGRGPAGGAYCTDSKQYSHVTGEAEAIVSGVSRRETALAGGAHRG